MISSIKTRNAPAAIGPYSQGVIAGDFYFLSGQIPTDPETGALVDGDIESQTMRVLENIKAILSEVNLNFGDVVKTTVYLRNMDDFEAVNKIYGDHFNGSVLPARSAIGIEKLPKGSAIEIEVIAYKG